MNISAIKLSSWMVILLFHLMAIVVHEVQLVDTNAYMGFQTLGFTIEYIIRIALGFTVLWMILPNKYQYPSDYLLFIYGLFTLAPFVVFGQVNGRVFQYYFIGLIIIATPLILIKILKRIKFKISIISLLDTRYIAYALLLFSLATATMSFSSAPASSGFTLADSYDRRIEGRDIYLAGSFLAYAIGMTVNGIAPFLSFYSGLKNSKFFFLFSFMIAVMFFYLLGFKAPVAYIFLSFGAGMLIRKNKINKLPHIFLALITSMFFICFGEWVVMNYSLLAEISFRRINVVPGQMMSHYLEMISNSDYWSLLSGVEYSRGVTYLVGCIYYTCESNANTNAFIYSLAAGGLFGYIVVTFLVTFFYFLLDNIYSKTRSPSLVFVGLFYGLLIVEQAAPTALVSSGFALLTMLFLLEKRSRVFFLSNKNLKV